MSTARSNFKWMKRGALALGAYLTYKALRKGPESFANKVVLITGASKGLGMIMARDFGREGARVAIVARRADELQRAEAWLRAEGVQDLLSLTCDVADQQQVQLMVDRVLLHYGTIDVLVNNAGTIAVAPLDSMGLEDFQEAHRVMFWGQVYPTFAVLPFFQQRRSGSIVNITSIGGMVSLPHLLPYSTAKFAAVGFSQGLHAELGRYGIKVTTILPGLMRTGSHINAQFKSPREYAWFASLSSLPGLSLDAEKASQQILAAARSGKALEILGIPAKLGATVYTLFPNFATGVLTLANRFLPGPSENARSLSGRMLRERDKERLAGIGQKEIERYQLPTRENHPENTRVPQF